MPAPTQRRTFLFAAVPLAWLTAVTLAGCSANSANTAGTEPAKGVVVAFLEAIKQGDETSARGMLTKLARTKTEEMGISVAPPVRDSATYSVRACEMVSESNDLVHVGTTWTDVDGDGFKTSENVVWVVRLDPEGWRVVGMAMRVFDDMPPLLLNFEDPEDMIAKQEMVAAELDKRAKQEATQPPPAAQKPAAPRTARGEQAPAQVQ